MRSLAVIAGSAHPALAADIARAAGVPQIPVALERFPDSEISVRLLEAVSGRSVAIVQPTGPPVDANFIELLALSDACRRAGAERVIGVVPYFGYARADRRGGRRTPIMASLVAHLMQAAGIGHVITVDLHAPQIEGFFQIPVDELGAFETLLAAVRPTLPADITVVSPDLGRVGLATQYADRLGTPTAVVHKRRLSGRETLSLQVVGDVLDRACLIVDDMISTGGTMAGCVDALIRAGARRQMVVVATHGLFLAGAERVLSHPAIRAIWVTDTLPQPEGPVGRRMVVSIAPCVVAALQRLGEIAPS